jgi:polysaccharide export outer membrane protein
MKSSYLFYILPIVILIQTSCRSVKDITMFQELNDDPSMVYTAPPAPRLQIKPFDNLYISVLTLDPEVNKILNPNVQQEGNSSGTAQNFGFPVSQYINGYRVSADSLITLPILGDINLVGLTLGEAHEHLKMRANEFLKEPEIQVKFLNYRVNISGEIRTPGIYYNYEGNLNMLDAIGMANGITEFADLKNVIVKRQNESNFVTHKVDLTNNSIYSSDVFYLQPNDLVYIPPSDLKRRSVNSDTYAKFLGTISTLLVAAALILRF